MIPYLDPHHHDMSPFLETYVHANLTFPSPEEIVSSPSLEALLEIGHPIDSGIDLSITIDKIRVFINKTLSTQSLINQLLIKRVDLSISIDSR